MLRKLAMWLFDLCDDEENTHAWADGYDRGYFAAKQGVEYLPWLQHLYEKEQATNATLSCE